MHIIFFSLQNKKDFVHFSTANTVGSKGHLHAAVTVCAVAASSHDSEALYVLLQPLCRYIIIFTRKGSCPRVHIDY